MYAALKSTIHTVRPAMMYDSERWVGCKQYEQPLHTTDMKMVRCSKGKTMKPEEMRKFHLSTLSWYRIDNRVIYNVMGKHDETHITKKHTEYEGCRAAKRNISQNVRT